MTFSTYVESELRRATILTSKDGRQRWVTMDGKIHTEAVPFRDAISVRKIAIGGAVVYAYRDRLPFNPAIGAI